MAEALMRLELQTPMRRILAQLSVPVWLSVLAVLTSCASAGGQFSQAQQDLKCERCGTVVALVRVYSASHNVSASGRADADVVGAHGGAGQVASPGLSGWARSIAANPIGVGTTPGYRIEVQMRDGSRLQHFQRGIGDMRVGDLVKVENGRVRVYQ